MTVVTDNGLPQLTPLAIELHGLDLFGILTLTQYFLFISNNIKKFPLI